MGPGHPQTFLSPLGFAERAQEDQSLQSPCHGFALSGCSQSNREWFLLALLHRGLDFLMVLLPLLKGSLP